MTTRDVELLGRRLGDLGAQAVVRLALAVVAYGGALAASGLYRPLAIPLLLGAIALTMLGLASFIRREWLLDDAVATRDAFAVDAVRRHAARLATGDRRRADAASIRRLLAEPELAIPDRVEANREALERLAAELECEELSFDPDSAVRLDRLLLRPTESALYSAHRPAEDVRSCLVQIEAGLHA